MVLSHGSNTSGGRFGDAEIDSTSIGLQLNLPLYQGGLVNSRTREARHLYNRSMQRLEQVRRSAQRLAREAYLGVISSISRINALQQATTSSETALNATEIGFSIGTRTAVDVVNSQRTVLDAKRNYARARYDYLINRLYLKQAVGTLSPEDLQQIAQWLN